jgi:hypothetical protein
MKKIRTLSKRFALSDDERKYNMLQYRIPGIALIALLSAALCMPAAVPAQENAPRPRAVVENAVHDWGAVYAGEKIIYSFVIANPGDAPLKIGSVRTG